MRFEVETEPRMIYAAPTSMDETLAARPTFSELIGGHETIIRIPTFFQDDARGDLLFQEFNRQIHACQYETARHPTHLLVDFWTFVEIRAQVEARQRRDLNRRFAIPVRFIGDDIEFLGVKVLIGRDEGRFIEALPPVSYLMSRPKPKRFVTKRTWA